MRIHNPVPIALVPENRSSVTLLGGEVEDVRRVYQSVLRHSVNDQVQMGTYANDRTYRTPGKHQKGEGGFKQQQTNAANSLSR